MPPGGVCPCRRAAEGPPPRNAHAWRVARRLRAAAAQAGTPMAELLSVQSEIRLSFRLLGKASDPFEKSLEWFDYELAIQGGQIAVESGREAAQADRPPAVERRSARGKFSSKRSEEHTSELQSRPHLVCRLLLEKKNVPGREILTRHVVRHRNADRPRAA